MPDVACLQEVDKLDHHGSVLTSAGYSYSYQIGYSQKLHGLCIAWKKDIFEHLGEKLVKLDDAVLGEGTITFRKRTGCSRITRNIGLFVALQFKDHMDGHPKGIIVITRKFPSRHKETLANLNFDLKVRYVYRSPLLARTIRL